jgi:Do/DeqQ family serine protease
MNLERFTPKQQVTRAAVAVVASALLMTGAAWHVVAADRPAAAAAATVTSPITAAVAGGRDSYADVVKVAAPAVVTIRTEGKARMSPTQFQAPDDDLLRRFFGDRFGDRGDRFGDTPRQPRSPRQRGLGSGVIVTADGYILTNYHVVDGADAIRVELTDGRTEPAKVVGSDKASDLALLKVAATGLHPLALGNSDNVQVGDVVLAVGNPLGVGQTVTMGIISAKGRSTGVGDGSYEDFLQTDAPINHGNSGGALVNTKGELVGINSQILSNSDGNIGIGFAIPSNMAKSVVEQLRTSGHVTRSQLGVTIQPVTSEMAENLGLKDVGGVIISSVAPGSAADRAGLKRGDVIQSFNGEPVHDFNALRNRVASTAPGSTANLTIVRDGSEKHMSVKLDEASSNQSARRGDAAGDDKAALGLSVAPLTPETAGRFRAPKDAHGVVVQEVNPDGRAASAGVLAGDIIEEVNRQPVRNVDDLRTAVQKGSERPLLLLVSRQGNELFVTVPRV